MLGGRTKRTPGEYYRVDPETGRETTTPLRDTREYVHPSVRTRLQLHGPGVEDDSEYHASPLDDYRIRKPKGERRTTMWEPRNRKAGQPLPESPLLRTERDLLYEDPKMWSYLMGRPESPEPVEERRDSPEVEGGSRALSRR